MSENRKIWFITGISRGLGLELAKAVLAGGDIVVAQLATAIPLCRRCRTGCTSCPWNCR